MESNNPVLFVEINELDYIFAAGSYDENKNLKIVEKIFTNIEGINNKKFTDIDSASKLIKKKVEIIEKNLNYIFKDVIIIIDNFNYSCTNISGYKKLNGTQVLKENISYILNSLKSAIIKNEEKKKILHIFNSKSVLDNTDIPNLPIGLFGNFYNHELTFFLIDNNDIKNIKHIFNKSNLEVKKIFLKSFSEGTQLINTYHEESFFIIKIGRKTSKIIFFDRSSFRYSEYFNFGTNIIIQDIKRICSLENEEILKFLLNNFSTNKNLDDDIFLEKKYFIKSKYRKIRKKLILDIAKARIEEISEIILNKNINIHSFRKDNPNIYIIIKEKLISDNFKESIILNFSKYVDSKTNLINDFEIESLIINTDKLSRYGWKKEAIPIVQTKNSLITRIFKSIFE